MVLWACQHRALPRERLGGGAVPRHRHAKPYAAVVVSGGYDEAGDAGRFRVTDGDVIVHRAFEAHLNVIRPTGAVVLNVPLCDEAEFPSAFRVADPDLLIQAGRAKVAAMLHTLAATNVIVPQIADWPDLLAAAINASPSMKLGRWTSEMGLAPATVSRGFRQVFGISPATFRAEARARHALKALRTQHLPLATLAHDLGFADQAHMSRSVRALAGVSPTRWRQVKSVQEHDDRSAYANEHANSPSKPQIIGSRHRNRTVVRAPGRG